jgi:hypothetical protein
VEKIVKQAFDPALGVESQAQGRKRNHNILGVASSI